MTNGERLYKSNMHDILCRIQNAMDDDEPCIINVITGSCFYRKGECVANPVHFDCEKCIEHWLNKEEANWK